MQKRRIEVYVYDCKEDSHEDYAAYQIFYVQPKDLSLFLKVCKQNFKYVEINLDYQEERKGD